MSKVTTILKRSINLNNLKRLFYFIFILSTIVQGIAFWKISESDLKLLQGDPKYYIKLVDQKLETSNYYPDKFDEFSDFIWNPGFINIAMFLKWISGSHKTLYLLNIICYLLSSILIVKLGINIKGEGVGYLGGILYLSAINYALLTPFYMTQIIFGYLLLTYIFLISRKSKKSIDNFFTGITLGVANWIRPFGLFALIAAFPFYIQNKKIESNSIIKISFGFVFFILLIGFTSSNYIGKFIYQTTTSGLNMRMGAMPNADGGFREGAYSIDSISNLANFEKRDEIRKRNAINWIRTNKLKFIKLIPVKIINYLGFDTYSFDCLKILFFSYSTTSLLFIKKVLIYLALIRHYLCIIFFIFGAYILLKQRSPYVFFFMIFLALNLMIVVSTVGLSLYRHHIFLLSIPITSIGLYSIIKRLIPLDNDKKN